MEEALWERLSFRRFVGLGLQDDAPDHSTISRFRTRLTTAGLAEPLFAAVEQQLAARGMLVKQGTLVDATLVAAQVRRPKGRRHRRGQPPGPGRGLGPAGPTGALRLQAAPGGGRRLGTDPARGADPGERERDPGGGRADRGGRRGGVWGCGLWPHARSTRLRALGIADRLMPAQQTSSPAGPGGAPPHARIEQVRRPVEHVFGTLKRSYGYQRVRYRGLARRIRPRCGSSSWPTTCAARTACWPVPPRGPRRAAPSTARWGVGRARRAATRTPAHHHPVAGRGLPLGAAQGALFKG